MANPSSLKPFKKGYDPRRNLKGVPKDTIAARKLVRRVASELLRIREKQENDETVEYDITRLEAMIRLKFSSRAPKDFETILKALYPGLLKEEVDVTSGGERIVFEVVRNPIPNPPTDTPPQAGCLPEQPSTTESDRGGQARGQDDGGGDAGG